MAGNFSESDIRAHDATWGEMDELLADATRAARTGTDVAAFYGLLLQRAGEALAVTAGGVWRRLAGGPFQRCCDIQMAETLAGESAGEPGVDCLAAIVERGIPLALPPHSRLSTNLVNPAGRTLLSCPVLPQTGAEAVIVLFQDPAASPRARQTALEVLEAFSETAVDFEVRFALQTLQRQDRSRHALDVFAESIHRSLDVEQTAYIIANDARPLLGCDRLGVVGAVAGRVRTWAISGIDRVDRRATLVRALEAFAGDVARTGESIRGFPAPDACSAELRDTCETYQDVSLARTITAVPLAEPVAEPQSASPRVLAVLVAEWFTQVDSQPESAMCWDSVCRHTSVAVANAVTVRRIPGAAFWRRWNRPHGDGPLRRWRAALALLVLVLAAVAVIALVPAEFSIPARGQAQPQVRQHVFAATDGVVEQLLVAHGDHVAAGQLLLKLQNPDLELESARVTGELATADQQLRSIRAKRWSAERGSAQPGEDPSQLAAQEESVKELVTSLREQQTIILRERDALEAHSPIAGTVVTWRVEELLRQRPVARGQELVTIADEQGPWILDLHVDDRDIRHVLAAQDVSAEPLRVAFRLASDPNSQHTGEVRSVAQISEPQQGAAPAVAVEVAIDGDSLAALRPGAEVVARIHCGQRPLGYVWFHDIWAWITSHAWW